MTTFSGLTTKLHSRKQNGLFRERRTYPNLISFITNDYLGLSKHPTVINNLSKAARKYGINNCASPLLGGYTHTHKALENELAEFLGYPKVLLFSSGYLANISTITGLFHNKTHIFADRLNHASLNNGIKYSQAFFTRYPHCNIENLKKHLGKNKTSDRVICSDGVFSMDGDSAPLKQLAALAHQTSSLLMIDDAHGVGTIGKEGKGILEVEKLTAQDVSLLVGSFSKAFGTFGGFVAANNLIIENLIQFSQGYIYSSALPITIAEATRTSLKIIRKETWRRDKLQELIAHFKHQARKFGLEFLNSDTPIQILIIQDTEKCLRIHKRLLKQKILVGAIRFPTVPANSSRLRISLNINHTKKDLDHLIERPLQH